MFLGRKMLRNSELDPKRARLSIPLIHSKQEGGAWSRREHAHWLVTLLSLSFYSSLIIPSTISQRLKNHASFLPPTVKMESFSSQELAQKRLKFNSSGMNVNVIKIHFYIFLFSIYCCNKIPITQAKFSFLVHPLI